MIQPDKMNEQTRRALLEEILSMCRRYGVYLWGDCYSSLAVNVSPSPDEWDRMVSELKQELRLED